MDIFEPLLLEPSFKEKIWGGRRLEALLGKRLPPGPIGESWELSTHPRGPSRVREGRFAGRSLEELIASYPEEILGPYIYGLGFHSLPLLVKFIDASQRLSVQVHPDDAYSLRHDGEAGKTEMWYVLDAPPGARLVFGLRAGVDRDGFAAAVAEGRVEETLRFLPIAGGDTLFVPPGTVHAILEGVLLLEVQESSDATYRLYDWGRLGFDGRPRKLHLRKALEVITFAFQGRVVRPQPEATPYGSLALLASCPYFQVERIACRAQLNVGCAGDRFCALILTQGSGRLSFAGGSLAAGCGDTLLLPAAAGGIVYSPEAESELIRIFVP